MTVSAAIQQAPSTDPNPVVNLLVNPVPTAHNENDNVLTISNTDQGNIQAYPALYTVTASYRGATRSVSVRIVPQLLNSTVVPNDYLFRDATGPYFYNLS
ncbi:MAG: hypothetical protein LJE70_09625, partial [Chromatiaceae bacterium]|nr:hypothetical protein [Chromatiaceae bacterium]